MLSWWLTLCSAKYLDFGKEEDAEKIPFAPSKLGVLAKRIEEDVISQSMAKKIVELLWKSDKDVRRDNRKRRYASDYRCSFT